MTTNAEETSIALAQGALTVDPESELKRFGKRLLRDKVGMISLVTDDSGELWSDFAGSH